MVPRGVEAFRNEFAGDPWRAIVFDQQHTAIGLM
jgi:hypothetical protein